MSQGQEFLKQKIDAALNYAIDEFKITLADIIGVLEEAKLDMHMTANAPDEVEEEYSDGYDDEID